MPDPDKRDNLLRTIIAQPEHKAGHALVNISEFFEGNDDLDSIGCNLVDHPGLDIFRRVIDQMAALPAVDQVWLQVYDIEEGTGRSQKTCWYLEMLRRQKSKSLRR